jgi:hypothetical protein
MILAMKHATAIPSHTRVTGKPLDIASGAPPTDPVAM